MYHYDRFDEAFVRERAAQFRDQVARRLRGELSEDEFRPLRLMNGLYLQLHAYMLRVAIPYGVLSSRQLRQLALIAERWDKGYGHFTTRQNIQFNWPALKDVPDILDALADVGMHAIQTSGNCIRNVTTDPWAGVAADEIADPRPWCELLRQWSSLHPEFSFLPRKFKIAVTGAAQDRAAVAVHDIGLRMHRDPATGAAGFEVIVGGGQGRTPMLGRTIRPFLPLPQLLPYVAAILRVYNRHGRRDNKFKARIKILVHELGQAEFTRQVEAEFACDPEIDEICALTEAEIARIARHFAPPPYERLPASDPRHDAQVHAHQDFAHWVRSNTARHKVQGHAIVTISLKPTGGIPGDADAAQMRLVADLADRYSHGEIRVTHQQNLVLPDVRLRDLFALWEELEPAGLGTPNVGLFGDIIACPGLDYCSLATARSIPIAQALSRRFQDLNRQRAVGPLEIKISGCINACGHHHVGHIGILGVDKQGQELYQLTLGGSAAADASLGSIVGPGFAADAVVDAVATVVGTYLDQRQDGETFLAFTRRVGLRPFKEALYAAAPR